MEPFEWILALSAGGTLLAYLSGKVAEDVVAVADSSKKLGESGKDFIQGGVIPLIVVGGAAYYFLVLRKQK
jgi:hypothetical protein